MEERRSYIAVGIVVLCAFVASILFALWIHQRHGVDDVTPYTIYFKSSVSGLSVGGPVKYKGILVGTVEKIGICQVNADKVCVDVHIKKSVAVRQGMAASLGFAGITGDSYVQLSGLNPKAPLLLPVAGETVAVIPAEESSFDKIFKTTPELLAHADVLVGRLADIFDPENRQSLTGILHNLKEFTDILASNKDNIDQIVKNFVGVSKNIEMLTKNADDNLGSSAFEFKRFMAKFSDTLMQADSFMKNIETQIQDLLPETSERTYKLS